MKKINSCCVVWGADSAAYWVSGRPRERRGEVSGIGSSSGRYLVRVVHPGSYDGNPGRTGHAGKRP